MRSNTLLFDTYNVKEGQTPEIIADKLYGDPNLHWIVLYVNNITDRYHDWPLSTPQFLDMIDEKYDNVDAIHHYEITQSSGSDKVKIDIGTDNTDYPSATPITNYEFELERQNTISRIRLLDPAYISRFVEEFESLMKESIL